MIQNFLSNVYIVEQASHFGQQEAWIWLLLPLLSAFGLVIAIACSPSPETKSIAILGPIGSGKTTLWQQLRNIIPQNKLNTSQDTIDSFKISINEKEVIISSTKDIGGGDKWVSYYDELIKEGTFVYYLVNLNNIEKDKPEIRARIQKIDKIISEKKIEHCGLKIVGTHFDEYEKKTRCSKSQAAGYIKQTLDTKSIKDVNISIDDRIIVINTLNDSDIYQIKKEIVSI